MTKNKLAIIGGSGLYEIEGLENPKWKSITTPWGKPSDEILNKLNYDKIAGVESRGFIFASPLSYNLSKPYILMRKKNKLPAETYSADFKLEYGDATLEIHKDSINPKEKIIIVDDLIATGGTSEASAKLVEKCGGKVSGFIFVINLFDLGGKKSLEKKGYKTFSLIDFPGH